VRAARRAFLAGPPRVAASLAALLWSGAVAGAASLPTPSAPPVRTERGAILSGEQARPVFAQCSRSAPRGAQPDWTPAAEEVARLEARLPAFIDGLGTEAPSRPVSQYRCQYVGFSRDGRRYVYANCFAHDYADGDPRPEYRDAWLHAPVVVCDGGDAFFGVEYDVASGAFANYAANGPYRPR